MLANDSSIGGGDDDLRDGATGGAGELNTQPADDGNTQLINNELLCYVQFYMHRSPSDNIIDVIKRFFSEE